MLGSCRPFTEPVTALFMLERHRATGASVPRLTPSHRLGLLRRVSRAAGGPSGASGSSGALARVQRGDFSGDAAGERLRTDLQR